MDEAIANLIRRHLQAENAQDLPGTLATLHPECRFDDFATGQTWHGHDGASAHYKQWWTTFDVEVKRGPGQGAHWTTDGLYVATATWHGRHIGPFLGVEPTGRPIVQPFLVILDFKDGLMSAERFHYDLASLLRQIAADPIPALASMPYRAAS